MTRSVFTFADTESTGVTWQPVNIGGFGDDNVLYAAESLYEWGTVSRIALVLWEGIGTEPVVWVWEK